ncbi:MAG: hypothetical protein ABF296_02985 [Oceanococcaceae bacterium]
MQVIRTVGVVALGLLLGACGGRSDVESGPPGDSQRRDFRFAGDAEGWTAHFVDYPAGDESIYAFDSGYRPVPDGAAAGSAPFIAGTNRSDDLFMYYRRRIDGLDPGQRYGLQYTVTIASEAQRGCVGIGGAPGESVYLKAGASAEEPRRVIDASDGWWRLSVDKGNQSQGGAAAIVLGTIENTQECGARQRFEAKTFSGDIAADADAQGRMWLFVGTDSGFEGRSRLYYPRITIDLTPAGAEQ